MQVSSRDLVHLGVDLVTQAGGEISNFKISEPTIRRAKKRASQHASNLFREEIKTLAANAKYPLIVHYDGKIIQELTEQFALISPPE